MAAFTFRVEMVMRIAVEADNAAAAREVIDAAAREVIDAMPDTGLFSKASAGPDWEVVELVEEHGEKLREL
jgi:hypothetical protein